MKVLGIIPARGGSKGIPGKNLKQLNGKPLLQYTIEAAVGTKTISKLILSSDDSEIMALGKQLGVEVPFKRPEYLALDNSPTYGVIIHALNYFEERNESFDAVCLLQPTSPVRTNTFIDKAVQKFLNEDADTLFSVQKVPAHYNPHWTFKQNKKGYLEISTGDENLISRRQDLPLVYHRDGVVYVIKSETLKKYGSLYGPKLSFIESPKECNINLDTMEDWKNAEQYFDSKKRRLS